MLRPPLLIESCCPCVAPGKAARDARGPRALAVLPLIHSFILGSSWLWEGRGGKDQIGSMGNCDISFTVPSETLAICVKSDNLVTALKPCLSRYDKRQRRSWDSTHRRGSGSKYICQTIGLQRCREGQGMFVLNCFSHTTVNYRPALKELSQKNESREYSEHVGCKLIFYCHLLGPTAAICPPHALLLPRGPACWPSLAPPRSAFVSPWHSSFLGT